MELSKNYTAFATILRKEVVRFTRIWSQTLLPPIINQSLYFIVFGSLIGSQLRSINGVSYMAFIVPGLVMMAVINSSFANVVSSFYGAKFQKNIEELLISPTPNWVIIAGYVAGGVLRAMIVGVLIFLISLLFVHPQIYSIWIIVLFAFLTSIVFALGGLINAVFAKSFDEISIIPTFVLVPLTYFGGVFYSINTLPEIFQTVSKFNPILYMVDGFRYGFFGVADVNIYISIALLVGMAVILAAICLHLLKKGTGLKN